MSSCNSPLCMRIMSGKKSRLSIAGRKGSEACISGVKWAASNGTGFIGTPSCCPTAGAPVGSMGCEPMMSGLAPPCRYKSTRQLPSDVQQTSNCQSFNEAHASRDQGAFARIIIHGYPTWAHGLYRCDAGLSGPPGILQRTTHACSTYLLTCVTGAIGQTACSNMQFTIHNNQHTMPSQGKQLT
jgi:hypothetical protein